MDLVYYLGSWDLNVSGDTVNVILWMPLLTLIIEEVNLIGLGWARQRRHGGDEESLPSVFCP